MKSIIFKSSYQANKAFYLKYSHSKWQMWLLLGPVIHFVVVKECYVGKKQIDNEEVLPIHSPLHNQDFGLLYLHLLRWFSYPSKLQICIVGVLSVDKFGGER